LFQNAWEVELMLLFLGIVLIVSGVVGFILQLSYIKDYKAGKAS